MSQALPLITRQGDRIAIVTGLTHAICSSGYGFSWRSGH
ncbi:3-ketoacyl-CoA thiolase [Klebsiella pneumoniae]|uniref:3-ketoacyl-CoA thiolase n=1 Tax=Klebsiella pneumoniae TaxID=573 RepID=A0A377TWU1_KLEPN|nr:3-ketoacyl-CoA thiolase [Klebsiella pneumoniae]